MVLDFDTKRFKPKIWFPGRLSKVKDNINDAEVEDSAGPYAMGTATDPTSFDSQSGRSTDSVEEDGDEEEEEDLSEPPSMPSFLCCLKLAINSTCAQKTGTQMLFPRIQRLGGFS